VNETDTVGRVFSVSRNKHTGSEGWLSDVVDDKSSSNITEVLLISYATVRQRHIPGLRVNVSYGMTIQYSTFNTQLTEIIKGAAVFYCAEGRPLA